MKVLIIIYLIIALLVFLIVPAFAVRSLSPREKLLYEITGESPIKYGKLFIMSLFWLVTLVLCILIFIQNLIIGLINIEKKGR